MELDTDIVGRSRLECEGIEENDFGSGHAIGERPMKPDALKDATNEAVESPRSGTNNPLFGHEQQLCEASRSCDLDVTEELENTVPAKISRASCQTDLERRLSSSSSNCGKVLETDIGDLEDGQAKSPRKPACLSRSNSATELDTNIAPNGSNAVFFSKFSDASKSTASAAASTLLPLKGGVLPEPMYFIQIWGFHGNNMQPCFNAFGGWTMVRRECLTFFGNHGVSGATDSCFGDVSSSCRTSSVYGSDIAGIVSAVHPPASEFKLPGHTVARPNTHRLNRQSEPPSTEMKNSSWSVSGPVRRSEPVTPSPGRFRSSDQTERATVAIDVNSAQLARKSDVASASVAQVTRSTPLTKSFNSGSALDVQSASDAASSDQPTVSSSVGTLMLMDSCSEDDAEAASVIPAVATNVDNKEVLSDADIFTSQNPIHVFNTDGLNKCVTNEKDTLPVDGTFDLAATSRVLTSAVGIAAVTSSDCDIPCAQGSRSNISDKLSVCDFARNDEAMDCSPKAAGDSSTPVFALWKNDQHYYPGTLESTSKSDAHCVLFEDHSKAFVQKCEVVHVDLPPVGAVIQADSRNDGYYLTHQEVLEQLVSVRACRLRNQLTQEEFIVPRSRFRFTRKMVEEFCQKSEDTSSQLAPSPARSAIHSGTPRLSTELSLSNVVFGKRTRREKSLRESWLSTPPPKSGKRLAATTQADSSSKKRPCPNSPRTSNSNSKLRTPRNSQLCKSSASAGGQKDWLSDWYICLEVKEDFSSLQQLIRDAGGEVIDTLELGFISRRSIMGGLNKMACLSHEPLRTVNYLACLASGCVACLEVRWLHESALKGQALSFEGFRLARGLDPSGAVISWSGILPPPFLYMNVLLITNQQQFWEEWQMILELGGARKVERFNSTDALNVAAKAFSDYSLVVCDGDLPISFVRYLKQCDVRPFLAEYLMQTVIQGKLPDPSASFLYIP